MTKRLLIVGASARAAAQSAVRSGFETIAADLFADLDLIDVAEAQRVNRYPLELLDVVKSVQCDAWMYTGCLENHPRLVDRAAAWRPLLGNPGNVLRQVRDPVQLAHCLADAGLPHLPVTRSLPTNSNERWLHKPLRSCGGGKITLWPIADTGDKPSANKRGWYFQQFVEGVPCSAVFVANGRRAALLGASEQLIGAQWAGASGFRYAGSLGPLRLTARQVESLERVGQCVTTRFGFIGLFGVDAVLADEDFWPLEVNPRFTASVELLERALGFRAVALHVAACVAGELPQPISNRTHRSHGKAIVFATAYSVVTEAFVEECVRRNRDSHWPVFADIPHPSTVVRAGQPIVTVFAEADSANESLDGLKAATERVRQVLSHK